MILIRSTQRSLPPAISGGKTQRQETQRDAYKMSMKYYYENKCKYKGTLYLTIYISKAQTFRRLKALGAESVRIKTSALSDHVTPDVGAYNRGKKTHNQIIKTKQILKFKICIHSSMLGFK